MIEATLSQDLDGSFHLRVTVARRQSDWIMVSVEVPTGEPRDAFGLPTTVSEFSLSPDEARTLAAFLEGAAIGE